jgi:CHAT domain-containing protein
MKTFLRTTALLILIAICASWFQRPLSFGENYESANNYPADFPKIIRPVDPSFSKDSLLADSLYQRIWKFYGTEQWDSMMMNGQSLQRVAERLLEQKFNKSLLDYWSYGYGTYAQALLYLGEIEAGSRISNEAFLIRKRVMGEEVSIELAKSYFGAGYMARDLFEDPDLALDFFKQAEFMARSSLPAGDIKNWPHIKNLVTGYWLKGDYGAAMFYFNKLINLESITPFLRFASYNELSKLHFQTDDIQNALKYALLAKEYWNETSVALFDNELLLARCYLKLKNLAACRHHLEICDQIFEEKQPNFQSKGFEADLLQTKSDYFFILGDFENSISLKKAASAVTEKERGGKRSLSTIQLMQDLAKTYLVIGKIPEARETINELLYREAKQFKAADFSQNPAVNRFTRQPYHLQTLALKGRIFERQYAQSGNPKDLQNALSVYLLADSLVDHLRDTYRGIGSKNQLAGSARPIYQQGIDCAFKLWKQTGAQDFLNTAWRLAEKSKSIELLESLRETEAKQTAALRPDDLFQENRIKRNLNFYEKLVFEEQAKSEPNTVRISNWSQQIVALKNTQDSLLSVFKKRYPEYHRLKYNRKIATIAEVREKLPVQTALIEYFMGDSILFTFLIDSSQCQIFKQNLDSTFHGKLAIFRTTVHDFNPENRRTNEQKAADLQNFTKSSHDLFRTLLAEPLSQTPADKLIVIPDDVIGYIPFAALLKNPVAPGAPADYRHLPYLVRDYAIRLEYSGTLLPDNQPAPRSGGYLGMAPSYPGGTIASRTLPDSLRFARAFGGLRGGETPALQYNREEIDLTCSIAGGKTRKDLEATEGFFKKNAPNAGVLHLAMHALTNDVDPLYSTLLFSGGQADSTGENDGLLHAYELYNLRLRANLAVLSACNTGAGKVIRGEGIMSLARAFRFAGCPNVMMSLWSVNDLAGKDMVVDFFKKLHAGMGKASALQAAQIDFLDNTKSDELMHPYYWATFILVGDDEKVDFGATPVWVWGLLGVGFIAIFLYVARHLIQRYFKIR